MGQFSNVGRYNITQTITVTPLMTASSYSSGFQVGGIMELKPAIRQDTSAGPNFVGIGASELVEITILDKASQNSAIDIFFFNVSPTLISTDHTAFNLTDANLVAACIGVVSVGLAYSASASNSVSSTPNLNKPLQVPGTSATPTSIFAVAVIRGAPTYTSTSDLQFQFSFFID